MTVTRFPKGPSAIVLCLLVGCVDDETRTTSDALDPTETEGETWVGSSSSSTTSSPGDSDSVSGTGFDTDTDTSSETERDPTAPVEAPLVDVPESEGQSLAPVVPGQSFGGVVDESDDDTFAFTLEAGQVLEVELHETIGVDVPIQIGVYARNDLQPFDDVNRSAQFPAGATEHRWQFFAPSSGLYEVYIRQNTFEQDVEGEVGYAFSSRLVELVPEQGPSTGDFEVALNQALVARAVTLDAAAALEAQVREIDVQYSRPDVRFWDPVARALLPVIRTFSEAGRHVSAAASEGTYWIIADADNARDGDRFSVSYRTADDAPGAPRELPLETPLIDHVASDDADYFRVTVAPGQVLRAEVSAPDELDVTLDVYAYADGDPTITARVAHGITAAEFSRLQFFNDEAQEHIIRVRTAAEVAGEYTIQLAATEWTPTPLEGPIALEGPLPSGGYQWFEGSFDGDTLLVLRGLETASGEPRMTTWDGSFSRDLSRADLEDVVRHPQAIFVATAQTYQFGFREASFRGGDGFELSGRLETVDLGTITFDTFPGSDSAVEVSTLPVQIDADVAEEFDIYRVAVEAGRLYIVVYANGADPETLDEGGLSGGLRFDSAQSGSWYGVTAGSHVHGVITHEATEDGTFEFEVGGNCTDDDQGRRCTRGDYSLRLLAIE